eukprot:GHVU01034146.1.p1 GENE.GHVU01034146.1~~GHVU01034146.1.p1  ORF type:complete len:126 (-),score=20.30 GHVU01034146.1:22-399(-)
MIVALKKDEKEKGKSIKGGLEFNWSQNNLHALMDTSPLLLWMGKEDKEVYLYDEIYYDNKATFSETVTAKFFSTNLFSDWKRDDLWEAYGPKTFEEFNNALTRLPSKVLAIRYGSPQVMLSGWWR